MYKSYLYINIILELELLEVREDIGGDSSDDREDTTID